MQVIAQRGSSVAVATPASDVPRFAVPDDPCVTTSMIAVSTATDTAAISTHPRARAKSWFGRSPMMATGLLEVFRPCGDRVRQGGWHRIHVDLLTVHDSSPKVGPVPAPSMSMLFAVATWSRLDGRPVCAPAISTTSPGLRTVGRCGVAVLRERLRGQVAEAVAGISPLMQLGDALSHGLGAAVPHDSWVLAGSDPVSGIRTLADNRHALHSAATGTRFAVNETVDRDAIRFTDLVRQTVPAGVLGGGADHDKRSTRLHELMKPEGFGSELRVCLRHRGAIWGGLILLRRDDVATFRDEDATLAAYAAAPALTNLRPRPSRPPHPLGPPPPPGVVILNEANTVRATSRQADTWIADMGTEIDQPDQTPRVAYELGLAARRRPDRDTANTPPVARVQTTSGRWLAPWVCRSSRRRMRVVALGLSVSRA